ncbi:methyl-CpG-binding domain protein 3-like 2B [Tenrec ecaudatus]|uniref:methyl-CpG-binding domain protein 3-like 2B n=1 Tax=Tenrec ecaudatus TaxID=94439 RepID=UPI003F5AB08E
MDKIPTTCSPNRSLLGIHKRNMMDQISQKEKRDCNSKIQVQRASALPLRRTSCIFQKPVTKITSPPGNEVLCRQGGEMLRKPQQICALKRLQKLQARSSEELWLPTLEFTDLLKSTAQACSEESLGHVADTGSCTRPSPTSENSSNMLQIFPGVGLHHPLIQGQEITCADIKRQTQEVVKARKKLAEAIRAHELKGDALRPTGKTEWKCWRARLRQP